MARLLGSATMANEDSIDSTMDIYPSLYMLVKSYCEDPVSTGKLGQKLLDEHGTSFPAHPWHVHCVSAA